MSFQEIPAKNNISKRKFHALRHTFATQLFKAGAPLLTVSKLLEHPKLNTTEIYTHVLEEQKEETINLLNKFFI